MNKSILDTFGKNALPADRYSSLTLAYIGDSVYEVVVRSLVIAESDKRVNMLNKKSSSLVKAHTQCEMVKCIEEILTAEEADVYKRGRNAKSQTIAKNASVHDYRNATGFEALIGYLYLTGKEERIYELVKYAFDKLEITP